MTGVTQFGFEIKSLEDIRLETDAALVAAIGAGFDTGVDTPQGQILSVFADAQSTMWELAQDVYASFDLRQATGVRLDALGAYRSLPRVLGETDTEYRARLLRPQNVSEQAVGRVQAAVSLVDGVESVSIFYNDTGTQSQDDPLAPLTISVSVVGGEDLAIAQAIASNLVFGLALIGNTSKNITTSIGVCRTIRFTRPSIEEIKITVTTNVKRSIGVCNGTSADSVEDVITNLFNTQLNGLGATVTRELLNAHLLVAGIASDSITFNEDNTLDSVSLDNASLFNLTPENLTVVIGDG